MCMSDICSMVSMIFFFKQKTAYEMLRRLVGSEMCIRDRVKGGPATAAYNLGARNRTLAQNVAICLLYTSDAADDLTRVDLGGRRLFKRKKSRICPVRRRPTPSGLIRTSVRSVMVETLVATPLPPRKARTGPGRRQGTGWVASLLPRTNVVIHS